MKKSRLLFVFSLILLLILITELAPQAAHQLEKYPVRFAIIGDRTGGHTPGIHRQIIEEIERLKPDFVITVGDMIEGYTDDTTTVNNEWKEYKSLVSLLSMPIYFTPGNHDIWDDASLKLYQYHIGKPYYSFNFRKLHFIVLDSSRWESSADLPKEQIDWLTSNLKKYKKSSCTFVLFISHSGTKQ